MGSAGLIAAGKEQKRGWFTRCLMDFDMSIDHDDERLRDMSEQPDRNFEAVRKTSQGHLKMKDEKAEEKSTKSQQDSKDNAKKQQYNPETSPNKIQEEVRKDNRVVWQPQNTSIKTKLSEPDIYGQDAAKKQTEKKKGMLEMCQQLVQNNESQRHKDILKKLPKRNIIQKLLGEQVKKDVMQEIPNIPKRKRSVAQKKNEELHVAQSQIKDSQTRQAGRVKQKTQDSLLTTFKVNYNVRGNEMQQTEKANVLEPSSFLVVSASNSTSKVVSSTSLMVIEEKEQMEKSTIKQQLRKKIDNNDESKEAYTEEKKETRKSTPQQEGRLREVNAEEKKMRFVLKEEEDWEKKKIRKKSEQQKIVEMKGEVRKGVKEIDEQIERKLHIDKEIRLGGRQHTEGQREPVSHNARQHTESLHVSSKADVNQSSLSQLLHELQLLRLERLKYQKLSSNKSSPRQPQPYRHLPIIQQPSLPRIQTSKHDITVHRSASLRDVKPRYLDHFKNPSRYDYKQPYARSISKRQPQIQQLSWDKVLRIYKP